MLKFFKKVRWELLSNFLEDLKADSVLHQCYKQTTPQFIETQKQLYKVSKGFLNPENIENPVYRGSSFRFHSVVLANHPDIGTQIVNKKSRAKILSYYDALSQLKDFYVLFDNVIKNIVSPHLAANIKVNEVIFSIIRTRKYHRALTLLFIGQSWKSNSQRYAMNLKAKEAMNY